MVSKARSAAKQKHVPVKDIKRYLGETYTGNVNHMCTVDGQSVWLSGNDLQQVVDNRRGELALSQLRLPIPTRMTGNLKADADGTIWVARHGDGVYRMSPGGLWSHYPLDSFEDLFVTLSNSVDGVIYASDHSGNICRYDATADRFVTVPAPGLKGISIICILNAGDGRVLFCTDGKGVRILAPNLLLLFLLMKFRNRFREVVVHHLFA